MAAVSPRARFARAYTSLLLALFACTVQAGEQRYDYDPLGRLIRSVGEDAAVEYAYDRAGNLINISSGEIQPPVITSGDLGDFRRNTSRQTTAIGNHLAGVNIRAPHTGITIGNVIASDTAVSFKLNVSSSVPLGAHQLVFESASGTVSVGLNVTPELVVVVEPQPVAVPPDNTARKFFMTLSEPDSQDQTFSLTTLAPNVAKPQVESVTIAAGQTSAGIGIIGVANGTTVLRLSNSFFINPVETIVTVSSGAGTQSTFTRPVGIIRQVPWTTSSDIHALSKSVGVRRFMPWGYAPDNATISKSVGIVSGSPYEQAPETLVVSPPVGISKP